MKKLVIAFAAVALATVTQAASVKWNSGTITGASGESLASSTAYTMVVTLYADAAGETVLETQTVTTATALGAYSGTMSYSAAASTTYYLDAVITSNDGAYVLTADIASFTTPASSSKTVNFLTGANFDTTGQKWSSAGWQSVPEPTSGLLMILGLAGLALRRKKA